MDDNFNNADTTIENKKDINGIVFSLYKSKTEFPIVINQLETSVTPLNHLSKKLSLFQSYIKKPNETTPKENGSGHNLFQKFKAKKKVTFTQPFTIFCNIQSLKRYNLKMTYSEYDSVPNEIDRRSKCNCKLLRECIII